VLEVEGLNVRSYGEAFLVFLKIDLVIF